MFTGCKGIKADGVNTAGKLPTTGAYGRQLLEFCEGCGNLGLAIEATIFSMTICANAKFF